MFVLANSDTNKTSTMHKLNQHVVLADRIKACLKSIYVLGTDSYGIIHTVNHVRYILYYFNMSTLDIMSHTCDTAAEDMYQSTQY